MRKAITLVLMALVLLGSIFAASPASARENSKWRYIESINFFYEDGGDISMDELVLGPKMNFPDYTKWHSNMRLFKSKANTAREVRHLKGFAKQMSRRAYPTAYCSTGSNKGYLLDLAFFYDEDRPDLTDQEKSNYRSWIKRFGSKNNCKVYPPHKK